MKKLLLSSLTLMTCSFPAAAWAGSDSGIYIGGSVGQAAIDAKYSDIHLDENSTGYKVLLGYNFGWVPLVDLGVEADYRDFGSFEDKGSQIKSDATAADIYGIAGLNFGLLGVFAKAGYSNTSIDTAFDGGKFSNSDTNPSYGIGAKIHLGSLAVRAEYETFDMDHSDDLSMWSVGATITF